MVLGKKSGKHAIEYKLKEMQIKATESQIDSILQLVKSESENNKSLVSDDQFKAIALRVISK